MIKVKIAIGDISEFLVVPKYKKRLFGYLFFWFLFLQLKTKFANNQINKFTNFAKWNFHRNY
jgi:hypothetical protein